MILCASAAAVAAFILSGQSGIRHYTAPELAELTCRQLGERHEEVIFAYHDAEIAYKRRTGAFHDDLGLPPEDVLPIAVLMKHFMRDSNISEADVMARATATPLHDSALFSEISATCATNPSWLAVEAMRQAAMNLGLIDSKEMD